MEEKVTNCHVEWKPWVPGLKASSVLIKKEGTGFKLTAWRDEVELPRSWNEAERKKGKEKIHNCAVYYCERPSRQEVIDFILPGAKPACLLAWSLFL